MSHEFNTASNTDLCYTYIFDSLMYYLVPVDIFAEYVVKHNYRNDHIVIEQLVKPDRATRQL